MKDRFSLSFKAFYLIYLGAIGSFIPYINTYLEKNAGNVQGMAGATEALKFNKMDVVVVAGEDGMVKTIDMDCAMSSGSGEEAMDVTYQISMEYLGINTDLKIDFPDFSDYQELTV